MCSLVMSYCSRSFLNQVSATQRPVHAWLLETFFVREVSMHVCVLCVCPPPRPFEIFYVIKPE